LKRNGENEAKKVSRNQYLKLIKIFLVIARNTFWHVEGPKLRWKQLARYWFVIIRSFLV